jgi:hypothetical protein
MFEGAVDRRAAMTLSTAGIDKTSHTKDAAKGRRLRNDYAKGANRFTR